MPFEDNLYQIADELRVMAGHGLIYANNGYDKERYERILKASARILDLLGNGPAEEIAQKIYAQFLGDLFHLSPLIGAEALVFRAGKILLIQRSDDHLWALPGGLTEPGETLARGVERELWEEAGLHGRAVRLLAVLDSRKWQTRSRMHLFTALFLLEADGEPILHGQESGGKISPLTESLAVDFFAENDLPPLSQGHHLRVPFAFRLVGGEEEVPYFDRS